MSGDRFRSLDLDDYVPPKAEELLDVDYRTFEVRAFFEALGAVGARAAAQEFIHAPSAPMGAMSLDRGAFRQFVDRVVRDSRATIASALSDSLAEQVAAQFRVPVIPEGWSELLIEEVKWWRIRYRDEFVFAIEGRILRSIAPLHTSRFGYVIAFRANLIRHARLQMQMARLSAAVDNADFSATIDRCLMCPERLSTYFTDGLPVLADCYVVPTRSGREVVHVNFARAIR